MSGTVVPTWLNKVHTFEAVTTYVLDGEGRRVLPERTTPTIETQIDQWVNQTKNMIISTSPPNLLSEDRTGYFTGYGQVSEPVREIIETRMLAVIYVPAVEQQDVRFHGDQQRRRAEEAATLGTLPQPDQPVGAGTGKPGGNADKRSGGTLGLPAI